MKFVKKIVEDLELEFLYLKSEEKKDEIEMSIENKLFIDEFLHFIIPTAIILLLSYAYNLRTLFMAGLIITGIKCFIKILKNNPKFYIGVKKTKNEDVETIKEEIKNYKTKELSKELSQIDIVETKYLETNNIIEELKKELDILYSMYELPPFIIEDDELEVIVKNISNDFNEKEIRNRITFLIRTVLAKGYKEQKEVININYLINNIYYAYGIELDEQSYKNIKRSLLYDLNLLRKTKKSKIKKL